MSSGNDLSVATVFGPDWIGTGAHTRPPFEMAKARDAVCSLFNTQHNSRARAYRALRFWPLGLFCVLWPSEGGSSGLKLETESRIHPLCTGFIKPKPFTPFSSQTTTSSLSSDKRGWLGSSITMPSPSSTNLQPQQVG